MGSESTPSELGAKPRGGSDAETPGSRADRGIFDGGLEAYRTVSDEEYAEVLRSGLTVLDTNVLLDLYRYHIDARQLLLAIMEKLGSHLWIPDQVVREFLHRRESTIRDVRKEASEALQKVRENFNRSEETVRQWANRVGLPNERVAGLLQDLAEAFKKLIAQIEDLSGDHSLDSAEDTKKDPVLSELEWLRMFSECPSGLPIPGISLTARLRCAKRQLGSFTQ